MVQWGLRWGRGFRGGLRLGRGFRRGGWEGREVGKGGQGGEEGCHLTWSLPEVGWGQVGGAGWAGEEVRDGVVGGAAFRAQWGGRSVDPMEVIPHG